MAAPVEVPTHAELRDLGKAAALLRTDKLSELSFSPGYIFDVLNGLAAALCEEALRIGVENHLRTFFGSAQGEHLDRLIEDHLRLPRQEGAAAVDTVRFSRPATTAGNVLIEAGTVLATADGTLFVTTDEVLLTGLQIDSGVRAQQVGEQGNVAIGTITTITQALDDASITVTNLEGGHGGTGRENDTAYRARAILYRRTLRRGTVLALETGAKFIAGIVTASVDESAYPPTVYVADTTGSANTELVVAVAAELINWRAAGIQVNVVGATLFETDIAVSLVLKTGFDTSAVRERVAEAILAAVATLSIGETLYRSLVIAAARSIDGVVDATVTVPAGDLVPEAYEVIRTTRTRITFA